MARYIAAWDSTWDRLAKESGPRSGGNLGKQSSPRWDSRLREVDNRNSNTSQKRNRGGHHGFGGGNLRGQGSSHEASLFQGGGSRQDGDGSFGRVGSLQVECSYKENGTHQRYSRVSSRQSKSI